MKIRPLLIAFALLAGASLSCKDDRRDPDGPTPTGVGAPPDLSEQDQSPPCDDSVACDLDPETAPKDELPPPSEPSPAEKSKVPVSTELGPENLHLRDLTSLSQRPTSHLVWDESLRVAYQTITENHREWLETAFVWNLDDIQQEYQKVWDQLEAERIDSLATQQVQQTMAIYDEHIEASRELVDKNLESFEQQYSRRFTDFQSSCQESLRQSIETYLKRIDSLSDLRELDGLTEEQVLAAQRDLTELVEQVEELENRLCLAEDQAFDLYPSYQRNKQLVLEVFETASSQTPLFWDQQATLLKEALRPYELKFAKIWQSFRDQVKTLQLKAMTGSEWKAFLAQSFALGLRELIDAWYWEALCEGGRPSPPNSAELCGASMQAVYPAIRQARTEAMIDRLHRRFQSQYFRNLYGSAELEHLMANLRHAVWRDFSNLSKVGIEQRSARIKRLLRINQYDSPWQSRRNEHLFDAAHYLRANQVDQPWQSRRNEHLFDAVHYLRANRVDTVWQSRRDSHLFDSVHYIRANGVDNPWLSRREQHLFDAAHYIRANMVDSPWQSRRESSIYDCLAFEKKWQNCRDLTNAIGQTIDQVHDKMLKVQERIQINFENNRGIPAYLKAVSVLRERLQEEIRVYPLVNDRYGMHMIEVSRLLTDSLLTAGMQDGQLVEKHLVHRLIAHRLQQTF